MEKPTFPDLGLSPEILRAVEALGFEEASPIQAAAIPILLQGRDVVGQSQTGSGKTAAFAIPAIEKVDPSRAVPQILILCPTRELATQVADDIHKLMAYKPGLRAVPIYGGASYERQFYELKKGAHIVIGTPGRVIDHLDRGTLKLEAISMAILDEADRMLDMGFRDDIQRILETTPPERQTVFFSATISGAIRDLIRRYSRDPETIKMAQQNVTVPTVEQHYYEVPGRNKFEALTRLIDFHGYRLGIVFCNTQRMVDELADMLLAQGFAADRLHGGIPQAQRTRVMNKFKKAEFEFLVATDVAARGIDVDDLELVVNYDVPYDAEDYVHRVGRTGRAGRNGMAATFVTGREIYKIQHIERFTRSKIRRGNIPTQDEVEMKRADVLFERIRATLESGQYKLQTAFVDRLLEQGYNPTDIASVLLHHLVGSPVEPSKPATPSMSAKQVSPVSQPATAPPASAPALSRQASALNPQPPRPVSQPSTLNSPPQPPRSGMTWVRLNVGREDGAGPRDIVDLLVNGTKLPGKTVGSVELAAHEARAEVIGKELPRVAESVRVGRWNERPVKMEVVRAGAPMREPRPLKPKRAYAEPPAKREHNKPWKRGGR